VAITEEPKRPWVKLQLPSGAGQEEWAALLHDLDAWLRKRGDGTTIYDVQPVRDAVSATQRTGLGRRASDATTPASGCDRSAGPL
jgi:hypothetical protein